MQELFYQGVYFLGLCSTLFAFLVLISAFLKFVLKSIRNEDEDFVKIKLSEEAERELREIIESIEKGEN